MQFDTEAKKYNNPEKMAAAYLVKYFGNQKIEYPINHIKVEDKKEYVAALSRADQTGDYDELYEIVFRLILRSYVDLHKQ